MKRISFNVISVVLSILIIFSSFTILGFAENDINLIDSKKVLLIQNDLPWHFSSNTEVLTKLNANYSVTTTSKFTAEMLSNYGVVILANDQTTATYSDYKKFKSELELFAQNGGTVVYGACDEGSGHGGSLSPELPGGVIKYSCYSSYNYIQDKNHPIVTGVLTDGIAITDADLYSNYCSHTCFKENTLPVGANVILRSSTDNAPTLIEYPYGEGLIIASGLTWEWGYDSSKPGEYSKKAMDDYFAYAIQYYNSIIEFTVDNVGINAGFKYNDTFFNASSYIYNHELAKASIGLATAAMINDNTYKNPEAAEKLFSDLKYENYTPYNYTNVPTANSIACVFANKDIDATKTSVIVVAVRGAGYEAEWGGNFNVGKSKNHAGFNIAKNEVLNQLNIFLETNREKIKYKDNVKFWITGYSRAAATANLVGQSLISKDFIKSYSNLSDFNYDAKDVFAYTFETPRNTTDSNAKNSLYNNIFNIINREDPVPRVAPAAWNYVRYGKDCYLPSQETSDSNYSSLKPQMKIEYEKITGKKYPFDDFKFYEIKATNLIKFYTSIESFNFDNVKKKVNNSFSKGVYYDGLLEILAKEFKSRNTYVDYFQDTFITIAEETKFNPGKFGEMFSSISEVEFDGIKLATNSKYRAEKIAEMLDTALDDSSLTYDDFYSLGEQVSAWNILRHPNYLISTFENAENLMAAHYPEETIAWMFAVDGDFKNGGEALSKVLTGGETYRVATINCPVDVDVYDKNGKLRASIVNDEVQEIEGNVISACVDDYGQKVFYLPNDGEYTFDINGNGEGSMSCSFADYNFDTCEKVISSNYYDIPITPDTEITAYLDIKSDDGITEDIVMIDEETGEEIHKSEVVEYSIEDIYTVSITTNSSTSPVFGGGDYYKGEHAQVIAMPTNENTFIGWYQDGILLSEDASYKFRVENDCVLEAKFTNDTQEPEYNYTFKIKQPSRTEIRNRDTMVLHAMIDGTVPEGSYIKWSGSNGNFSFGYKNGNYANMYAEAEDKGWTTITATLYDVDGNELARDSVELYSKSGFFDKIGGFFRSLFGTTKTYDE